ncbi:MAG: hypothetical protein ACREPM_18220, partial [Gemmatimonadaceae bacterium]
RLASDSGVWVAPVGDVAAWWRERALLDVRVRTVQGSLKVSVHNKNDDTVKGAVVRVSLPQGTRVGHADVRLLPAAGPTARLLVPPMAPRATRTLTLVLDR